MTNEGEAMNKWLCIVALLLSVSPARAAGTLISLICVGTFWLPENPRAYPTTTNLIFDLETKAVTAGDLWNCNASSPCHVTEVTNDTVSFDMSEFAQLNRITGRLYATNSAGYKADLYCKPGKPMF